VLQRWSIKKYWYPYKVSYMESMNGTRRDVGLRYYPTQSPINGFEPRSVPTEFGIRAVSPMQWCDNRMLAVIPYLIIFVPCRRRNVRNGPCTALCIYYYGRISYKLFDLVVLYTSNKNRKPNNNGNCENGCEVI